MPGWTPRDGDILTTRDGFIFYVFGYDHPAGRVFSYLKYIPSDYRDLFKIRYLGRSWKFDEKNLLRAEKLYTVDNYRMIIKVLRENFPRYIYFSPFHGKELISVPLTSISKVYEPRLCLKSLISAKWRDDLQNDALDLISLLSSESNVQLEDFGLHGSIALNMHTSMSDIDVTVYGSKNFRRVEAAIRKLVDEGELSYIFKNRIDERRRHRGRYKDRNFNYNAVRKFEEIDNEYGRFIYKPLGHVILQCRVVDDSEAMFRPAIYRIDYPKQLGGSKILDGKEPIKIVSMIGCYRNVARRGEQIIVSGILEEAEHVDTGRIHHQVVVGSGVRGDEYIHLLDN